MLLSERQRIDASTKRVAESDFGFLNRSAWEAIGVVRTTMEACIANYPKAESSELVTRIR